MFSMKLSERPHLDVTLAGISLCNSELQRLVERMVDLSKRMYTQTHVHFIFHNKGIHKKVLKYIIFFHIPMLTMLQC